MILRTSGEVSKKTCFGVTPVSLYIKKKKKKKKKGFFFLVFFFFIFVFFFFFENF